MIFEHDTERARVETVDCYDDTDEWMLFYLEDASGNAEFYARKGETKTAYNETKRAFAYARECERRGLLTL